MPEEHGAFLGTVLKFTKWKLKGQQLEGYEIRFEDGISKLPLADLKPHLL